MYDWSLMNVKGKGERDKEDRGKAHVYLVYQHFHAQHKRAVQ